MKKGKQPYVLTKSQRRKRLNVFGWIDPAEGRHGMIPQEKGNTGAFLTTLNEILHRYKPLIDPWVDHAPWHKATRVTEFLLHHTRLILHYIPRYHPELNFQEALWSTMRCE